jgi:hypothetical protein
VFAVANTYDIRVEGPQSLLRRWVGVSVWRAEVRETLEEICVRLEPVGWALAFREHG